MDQGGGRVVRYAANALTLDPPPPAVEGMTRPPATWRAASDKAQGQDTAVDLALFSWDPVSDARAYERSAELTQRVSDRWLGACDPVAPPAPVLWSFNRQPLGTASGGWTVQGHIVSPDPPSKRRSSNPNTTMRVHGPAFDPLQAAFDAENFLANPAPAEVIGFDNRFGGEADASRAE